MTVPAYELRRLGRVSAHDERVKVRYGMKTYTYTRRVLRIILSSKKLKDFAKYSRFDLYITEITLGDRKVPCIALVPAE